MTTLNMVWVGTISMRLYISNKTLKHWVEAAMTNPPIKHQDYHLLQEHFGLLDAEIASIFCSGGTLLQLTTLMQRIA